MKKLAMGIFDQEMAYKAYTAMCVIYAISGYAA
jgi:hypothetical protein